MGSTNFIGHAQFVQNGDFEDRETPNQMSQISNADYWSSGYAGTPDLFDVNGAPVVSMPAQTFVNPRSNGLVNECFAGFWGPTDEASDNEYI